jgi:hypothetical protein
MGPTQPPIQWLPGFSPPGKAGRSWSYSPPSTSQIKNEWSYTSTFSVSLCGMDKEYYTIGIKFIWLVLDTHTN